MTGINKVIILGHLGADPEIRRTQDGRPIANLRVATSETWKDKATGEKKERTEWHRVVIFNEGLAKIAEQYLKKGSKAYFEGQLATRKWQDQSGIDRYSTEIVLQGFGATLQLLDSADTGYKQGGEGPQDYGFDPDRSTGPSEASRNPSYDRDDPRTHGRGAATDFNDDIPF